MRIREIIDPEALSEVGALFDRIWPPLPGHGPEIAPGLLRLWLHTGQYLAGAFAGERLVAASVGFLGERPRRSLHSHITGVAPDFAGQGIGTALKQHQRSWARARDIATITWTFDPLVARNAHFNLNRLAARPVAYLPDFYGAMPDAVNAGSPTDRLFVHWDLDVRPASVASGLAARTRRAGPTRFALVIGPEGEPERVTPPPGPGPLAIGLPADIEALRRTDPAGAYRWRLELRRVLAPMLGTGRIGFETGTGYLIDPSGDP